MYSFNPCAIKRLLPLNEITCAQIHNYLITELRCEQRLSFKMYKNEGDMLRN